MPAICACASVAQRAEDYGGPVELPEDVVRQFCYEPLVVDPTLQLVEETRHYRLIKGSFAGRPDDAEIGVPITFDYYEQLNGNEAPVVLVLPILNGQKHIVRPFAKYFSKHGYAAIVVDTAQRTTLTEDLIDPQAAIERSVMRLRQVVDWVETRENLDADRIVVFGASLGGFNALYLAAVDDRIKVAVPALAAGDLPYVFTRSNEPRIERAVSAAKTQLSMDSETFEQHLRDQIETDLMALAPHVNADRILMVLARHDKAVPYEKQLEMRSEMGNPEAITLPTGHLTAAAYLFYLRRRTLEFFDRKLEEDSTTSTAKVGSALACG